MELPDTTDHVVLQQDAVKTLRQLPDESVQLVLIDPPYNIAISDWDEYEDYLEWSKPWLHEIERILKGEGSVAICGGLQFDENGGDLLTLMQYIRKKMSLRMVNLIIWYYKNGISAERFFANRHEEIAWFVKSDDYIFNLDAVREPYDEETKQRYLQDDRLNPETVRKGRNPTNVWEIGRLNGNSKERVGHETQKPVELISRLVKALSNPGDLVVDCFGGSGTTTTRVCIEQNRNSVTCDTNDDIFGYLDKHLSQVESRLFEMDGDEAKITNIPYHIYRDPEDWTDLFNFV